MKMVQEGKLDPKNAVVSEQPVSAEENSRVQTAAGHRQGDAAETKSGSVVEEAAREGNKTMQRWGSGIDFHVSEDNMEIKFDDSWKDFKEGRDKAKRHHEHKSRTLTIRSAAVLVGHSPSARQLAQNLLSRLIYSSQQFKEITCICNADFKYTGKMDGKTLKMVHVDFANLEKYRKELSGFVVAFCLLGSALNEVGENCFWIQNGWRGMAEWDRIDREQVIATCQMLKEEGCQQLHLWSAQNADTQSTAAFYHTKGIVEDKVQNMAFSRLCIYRPAFLHGKETHSIGEIIAANITVPLLEVVTPKDASVRIRSLTKAMIMQAIAPDDTHEILENEDILNKVGSASDGWLDLGVFPELDNLHSRDENVRAWTKASADPHDFDEEPDAIDVIVDMFSQQEEKASKQEGEKVEKKESGEGGLFGLFGDDKGKKGSTQGGKVRRNHGDGGIFAMFGMFGDEGKGEEKRDTAEPSFEMPDVSELLDFSRLFGGASDDTNLSRYYTSHEHSNGAGELLAQDNHGWFSNWKLPSLNGITGNESERHLEHSETGTETLNEVQARVAPDE